MSGFRHVVMFRWQPEATAEQREAAISALGRLKEEVADLGRLSVGLDAGLAEGNADVVVVGDFPNSEAYLAYQSDPRHTKVVTEYLRPIIAERVALQYEL
ncbi:hypothetical protein GCM10009547_06560 [Sporichthya brevicatena]|uniref:Stress-response A/B barrel domain-containing protein n=1 Tax=Sporichthya brevicatena TaxID=171442 RepID=A0ABN1GA72_9ACTN